MTEYLEDLPAKCPPKESIDEVVESAWRFIGGATVVDKDFYSHAKLNKENRKNATACDFASCSMFTHKRAKDMAKNQFFKRKLAAKLHIPQGAGKHLLDEAGHYHFWFYAGFDPSSAVSSVSKP